MLEQVGMFGRGIEEAGRSFQDAYTIIHQRETQAETSDAFASIAEQRAAMMERIQDETAKGTLNVDDIKKDYQSWVDKQFDTYQTTGGRNAFTRASSRAGGALLQSATRGYAAIQGQRAVDNLTTLSNTNSSMVMNDPSQFPDLYSSQVEAIQAQVENGALSQPQAERLRQQMSLELAKGAVRGHMQADYNNIKTAVVDSGGKIDPNTDRLNTARAMLDNGAFDEFLNSDQKKALQNEIRGNQAAAQTAGLQAIKVRQDAIAAQGEVFKVDAYDKLQKNALTPDSVSAAAHAGLISSDEQLKMFHLISQAGRDELHSDPQLKNSIKDRILSPDNSPNHISDPMDVAYLVKDGMLSMKDFQELQQTAAMVPQNRVNAFAEAKLMEKARAAIGTGPDAEYRLAQFSSEVHQAKLSASQTQTPIKDLFDPNSKSYLGAQLQKYVQTPQQVLHDEAERARGLTVAPQNVQTAPGVSPTPGTGTSRTPKIDDIQVMNIDQLKALNPKSLPPAEKAAAAARWRALKQAGGK